LSEITPCCPAAIRAMTASGRVLAPFRLHGYA
jgi:hypothetical protein